MQQPRPHTQTYTQMARAAGAWFVRAYTSTTRDYHRIKLYCCERVTVEQFRELFPEARVVRMDAWCNRSSIVLYFPR